MRFRIRKSPLFAEMAGEWSLLAIFTNPVDSHQYADRYTISQDRSTENRIPQRLRGMPTAQDQSKSSIILYD